MHMRFNSRTCEGYAGDVILTDLSAWGVVSQGGHDTSSAKRTSKALSTALWSASLSGAKPRRWLTEMVFGRPGACSCMHGSADVVRRPSASVIA
jgi:hypothetical protein